MSEIATRAHPPRQRQPSSPSVRVHRCRRKFLRFFPGGFQDDWYIESERDYKWQAHLAWAKSLGRTSFAELLSHGEFAEIAARAVRIESRTNLLFSFEKMALRDAVRSDQGAQVFATALFDFLHGSGQPEGRFDRWVAAVEDLPRKQTRVLTWPLVTVFGFIAQPATNIFLKPNVTRTAARAYGFDFRYHSRPSWTVYENYLSFAAAVQRDTKDLRPRDMIDIQSFIWVQGSDEYS